MLQTAYANVFDFIPNHCLECKMPLEPTITNQRHGIYYFCKNKSGYQHDSYFYFKINETFVGRSAINTISEALGSRSYPYANGDEMRLAWSEARLPSTLFRF